MGRIVSSLPVHIEPFVPFWSLWVKSGSILMSFIPLLFLFPSHFHPPSFNPSLHFSGFLCLLIHFARMEVVSARLCIIAVEKWPVQRQHTLRRGPRRFCSPCRQQRLIDLKLCSCSVDQLSGALCLSERGNSFKLK